MSITGRKALLRDDLTALLQRYPGGAKTTLKKMELIGRQLISDLAELNLLTTRFKYFQPFAMTKLVSLWQKRQLAAGTMQNNLSVLRTLLRLSDTTTIMPTNAALGIKRPKAKLVATKKSPNPILIPNTFIRDICYFEFLFGLKTSETLRFQSHMIEDKRLKIPRSISFNKYDRYIGIISPEQTSHLERFRAIYPTGFMPSPRAAAPISSLHALYLEKLHYPPEAFRHAYLLQRFSTLSQHYDHDATIAIVQAELGYRQPYIIKRILTCLGAF